MVKRLISGCLLVLMLASQSLLVHAAEMGVSNNKFGIHLAIPSEEDLKDAAELVNSSGGDWGYVTVVIGENDRDKGKWQGVFDRMRELHLIPIVRLATSVENGGWRRPAPGEAPGWADFLDSLNWVIKNRYVVLFNEPNHGAEWGGWVDSVNYGQVALAFAKNLKEKNPDFFVMLAGFDAAAPHQPPQYEDEEIFLRAMLTSLANEGNEIFDYLDGWASHSYPNHGFVGSPRGWGRVSIRGYLWELELLERLGARKDLPVFITETGWPHAEGINHQSGFYSESTVAQNFEIYFSQLVENEKLIAITPFILNYQSEPFDHFSWRRPDHAREFYSQYQTVQQLTKVKGEPVQEQKLKILSRLPEKLIRQSTYQIPIEIGNEGQAIWSQEEGYRLTLVGTEDNFEYFFADLPEVKPFAEVTVDLHLKTGAEVGEFDLTLVVAKDGEPVSNGHSWPLELVLMIKINFKVRLAGKMKAEGDDFKFLIYNSKEEVVFEKTGVKVANGRGRIEGVKNLAIGEEYRLVILKPYYLPRQAFLKVEEGENKITFKSMFPLDFDLDGKLSLNDFWTLIKNPALFHLWWLR